ncbi:MAG TPA: hypothetical protein VLE96_04455 [Chlamydiales bacterium]|nr:hypothetical protein [Chlamydiales bacterium]
MSSPAQSSTTNSLASTIQTRTLALGRGQITQEFKWFFPFGEHFIDISYDDETKNAYHISVWRLPPGETSYQQSALRSKVVSAAGAITAEAAGYGGKVGVEGEKKNDNTRTYSIDTKLPGEMIAVQINGGWNASKKGCCSEEKSASIYHVEVISSKSPSMDNPEKRFEEEKERLQKQTTAMQDDLQKDYEAKQKSLEDDLKKAVTTQEKFLEEEKKKIQNAAAALIPQQERLNKETLFQQKVKTLFLEYKKYIFDPGAWEDTFQIRVSPSAPRVSPELFQILEEAFSGKKRSFRLVYMPAEIRGKPLTLNTYTALAKTSTKNSKIQISPLILGQIGDKQAPTPYWALVGRNVNPKSANYSSGEQFNSEARRPGILPMLVSMQSEYESSFSAKAPEGESQFTGRLPDHSEPTTEGLKNSQDLAPAVYTCCEEELFSINQNGQLYKSPIIIGGIMDRTIFVQPFSDAKDTRGVGIAEMRTFPA